MQTQNTSASIPNFAPPRNSIPVAAYEECIAAYIVGKLALSGYMPPDFLEDMPNMTEAIKEWLLEGLAAYGWEGSVRELIHAGDLYHLMLSKQGGAE